MKIFFSVVFIFLFTTACQADTIIKLENTDTSMPETIIIKGGRVLVADPAREGRMIFDTNNSSIIIANDNKHEFMVVDEAYMKNIGGMVNSMKTMMAGLIDQVPEEQRTQIEEMLGGVNANNQAASTHYEIVKTGKMKTINSFPCEVTQLKENKQITAVACVAAAKDTRMNTQDYATLMKMGKIARSFADEFSQIAGDYADDLTLGSHILSNIEGIPVEVVSGAERSVMTSITEQAIENGVFGLAGYQQVDPLEGAF